MATFLAPAEGPSGQEHPAQTTSTSSPPARRVLCSSVSLAGPSSGSQRTSACGSDAFARSRACSARACPSTCDTSSIMGRSERPVSSKSPAACASNLAGVPQDLGIAERPEEGDEDGEQGDGALEEKLHGRAAWSRCECSRARGSVRGSPSTSRAIDPQPASPGPAEGAASRATRVPRRRERAAAETQRTQSFSGG